MASNTMHYEVLLVLTLATTILLVKDHVPEGKKSFYAKNKGECNFMVDCLKKMKKWMV